MGWETQRPASTAPSSPRVTVAVPVCGHRGALRLLHSVARMREKEMTTEIVV